MKQSILKIFTALISISMLQVNVIAIEKNNYSFDELIIERNVESPYTKNDDEFSEGLAVKVIEYNTGEFISVPGQGNLYVSKRKFGFVDSNNNETIPCLYDGVSGINSIVTSGTSLVGDSSFANIVKKPGFHEGIACVKIDNKWGAIDKNGNVIIPFNYTELEAFNEGFAKVKGDNNKYGFINKQGEVVIPMIYDEAAYFYNGYARVGKYNEETNSYTYGAIDTTGNLVAPMIYDAIADFHEGYAAVCKRTKSHYYGEMGWGLYGFVNTKGELVVPMIYTDAGDFSNGLAPVAIPDERFVSELGQMLYGYIDTNGTMLIQPQYSEANSFYEGLASVTKNSRHKVGVSGPNDILAEFNEPEMSGYIDVNGNEIIVLSKNYSSNGIGEENFTNGTAIVYKRDVSEYVRIKNPLAVSILVNGDEIEFDQPPIIVEERTLVPVRAIFEELGATVEWIQDTQTVVAQRDGKIITLQIDSNVMRVGNEDVELDVPAQIINDRTLVPVRAVAEAFECTVDWDGLTSTVIIKD